MAKYSITADSVASIKNNEGEVVKLGMTVTFNENEKSEYYEVDSTDPEVIHETLLKVATDLEAAQSAADVELVLDEDGQVVVEK